jgi:hypothetical protein
MDSSKRFLTVVLALGIVVLVAGIAVGERGGNNVIGQVTEKRLDSVAPVTVTPAPVKRTPDPSGRDWKRTDVMSAATDPAFPDPRIPPVPPPTLPPRPKVTAAPVFAPTPAPTSNMNLPIWRRAAPMPTITPPSTGSPIPEASGLPTPQPTTQP